MGAMSASFVSCKGYTDKVQEAGEEVKDELLFPIK